MKPHPVFAEPHRIFYPLAALAAFVMPALWISFYKGKTAYPPAPLPGPEWHALEMLFGFGMLLLAGYLPEHLSQKRRFSKQALLGAAVFFWITERVVALWPHFPKALFFLLSQGMGLSLFGIAIIASQNRSPKRSACFFPFFPSPWLALLVLFVLAKAVFLAAALGYASSLLPLGLSLGLYAMQFFLLLHLWEGLLANLVTGQASAFRKKITNAFFQDGRLFFALLLFAFLGTVGTALLSFVQIRDAFWIAVFGNLAAFALGLFFLWSLPRPWLPKAKSASQMLLVTYIILFISFLVEALAPFFPAAEAIRLHTFTAGAMGLFGLALMHSHIASLHAEAPAHIIHKGKLLGAMYACLLIGAVLRLLFPAFWPAYYLQSLHHSSGWWTLAYGLFLWRFVPLLFRKP